MKFKKMLSVSLSICLLLLTCVSVSAQSDEDSIKRGPINPITVNVNKTVNVPLQANGCYSSATFKITGSYVRTFVGGVAGVGSKNLKVQLVSSAPDWWVEYIGRELKDQGGNVKVLIRFKFTPSYIDCPFSGGPVYQGYEVVV